MKRYAVLIYTDNTLMDALPDGEFDRRMRGCLAHADALREQGTLHDSQMLEDATTAKSMRVRGGRRTVTDGPFTETKEMLAGFNLIEAEDMDEALRIAEKFPWAETGCVEVREIMDSDAMRERVALPGAGAVEAGR
jgi:hypothetical protein